MQLPMAVQANQQLFAKMPQHVGMYLQPSKSTYTHTQTDPAARVFKLSQKVFRFIQQFHPRRQLMITWNLPNTSIVG
jgi:hypothetical protein